MNKIVAVATAAAVPVVTPPLASSAATVETTAEHRRSPAACLKRAEEVVELLRTRYIREGWKMDEEAAERALSYCRAYTPDSDSDDEYQAAIDFFHSHGVSIDWVFDGDVAGLICAVAGHSRRASSVVDAALIALAEEYLVAQQRYRDLTDEVDAMEQKFKYNQPVPEVLRLRDEDVTTLDLPRPYHRNLGRELAWDCAAFVDPLRNEKWTYAIVSKNEEKEIETARVWRAVPPAEARSRADEIIAAYDKWKAEQKPPRGYRKLVREMNKADRAWGRLEEQIRDTRATTFEGMIAKLRCMKAYEGWDDEELQDGPPHTMALSLVDDLQAIATKA